MKDASERCRNCGSLAPGRYCAACGQETDIALPSAGRFLREAAGRYIAFDGRLWRSLQALLFRPGHVTLSTMNSYAHLELLGDKKSITYR